MARPTTLQLGLVTTYPPPVRLRWTARAARWEGFTSGMSSGHVGAHAVVAGVGDHGVAPGGEDGLGLAGDGGIEAGEQQPGGEGGIERLDHQAGHRLRDTSRKPPGTGFAIGLARRALGGHDLGHGKPGMIGQELDEALAHGAGGAQYWPRLSWT